VSACHRFHMFNLLIDAVRVLADNLCVRVHTHKYREAASSSNTSFHSHTNMKSYSFTTTVLSLEGIRRFDDHIISKT